MQCKREERAALSTSVSSTGVPCSTWRLTLYTTEAYFRQEGHTRPFPAVPPGYFDRAPTFSLLFDLSVEAVACLRDTTVCIEMKQNAVSLLWLSRSAAWSVVSGNSRLRPHLGIRFQCVIHGFVLLALAPMGLD